MLPGARRRLAGWRIATMLRNFVTAGLLTVLAIILGAPASQSEPRTVTLDLFMIDYKFIPNHLNFERDVHYRLHMENHGKETHEVTAPTFFGTTDIDNPEVLNRERTEAVMQPGDTKDLLLTAHKPGTYDLRCSDHDWNGMVGGITVE
jgi:plastocyanin